jgi:hypothetical protein
LRLYRHRLRELEVNVESYVPVYCPQGQREFEIVWNRRGTQGPWTILQNRIVEWVVPASVQRTSGPSGALDWSNFSCPLFSSTELVQCKTCGGQSCQPRGQQPWCGYCQVQLNISGTISSLRGNLG